MNSTDRKVLAIVSCSTVTCIARGTGLSRDAVIASLARLRESGLVFGSRSQLPGSVTRYHLTEEGAALLDA